MKLQPRFFAWLAAGALLAGLPGWSGCNKSDGGPSAGPAPAVDPSMPTRAQPKLPTIKLWVGTEELIAEMAVTEIQERTGMMFRTNIAENEAMLFVLPYTQRQGFWMTNCSVKLSLAYIDPAVIREIHPLEPHNTNSVVSQSDQIRFALETSRDWFDRHNVRTGMVIRTERGSLMETFRPR